MKKYILPLLLFCILGIFLETLVRTGFLPAYLFPAPSVIFSIFFDRFSDFFAAGLSTAVNSFIGLAAAFIFAFFLGILFSYSESLRLSIFPYAVFFQTVPIIAIAPLLVIWFGFGSPTVQVASLLVSFFPLLANIMSGLKSYSKEQDELFQLYQASFRQRLFYLMIPSAIPQIFVGLRVSIGLSIIGAVVGEFIAGGGLGGFIDTARTQQRVDLIFAAILLSSLLGLIEISLIQLAENLWLKKLRRIS